MRLRNTWLFRPLFLQRVRHRFHFQERNSPLDRRIPKTAEKTSVRQVFTEGLNDLLVVPLPGPSAPFHAMTELVFVLFALTRTVPTRIGAPTATDACVMSVAASELRSGSISDAFSGHTTRSGAGCLPASTSAASAIVSRTWLSSTARRCALKSSPRRGTLP